MIDKVLRNIVNMLIYGGFFIGLCAACITALTLEINGHVHALLEYVIWIGIATAALYCGHRVIGLNKVAHLDSSERFTIIRKYKNHIWIYFFIWVILAVYFVLQFADLNLLLWLTPGGLIAVGYILPVLSGGKRLRDLGWTKIIMIGWSWGWLTAFIPSWYLAGEPLQMGIIQGLERMLFIIAITIPFEVRDLEVDKSVGLQTLPEKFGRRRTILTVFLLCAGIVFLSFISGFHYYNIPYFMTQAILCVFVIWINLRSPKMKDDYFFSGLTDGLMIIGLMIYVALNIWM